jgi:hypothetical protein
MLTVEKNIKLKGPIITLSMKDIVKGHPVYGHNFQYYINELTDKIGNVAEYHVKEINGHFCVYYLTFEDLK